MRLWLYEHDKIKKERVRGYSVSFSKSIRVEGKPVPGFVREGVQFVDHEDEYPWQECYWIDFGVLSPSKSIKVRYDNSNVVVFYDQMITYIPLALDAKVNLVYSSRGPFPPEHLLYVLPLSSITIRSGNGAPYYVPYLYSQKFLRSKCSLIVQTNDLSVGRLPPVKHIIWYKPDINCVDKIVQDRKDVHITMVYHHRREEDALNIDLKRYMTHTDGFEIVQVEPFTSRVISCTRYDPNGGDLYISGIVSTYARWILSSEAVRGLHVMDSIDYESLYRVLTDESVVIRLENVSRLYFPWNPISLSEGDVWGDLIKIYEARICGDDLNGAADEYEQISEDDEVERYRRDVTARYKRTFVMGGFDKCGFTILPSESVHPRTVVHASAQALFARFAECFAGAVETKVIPLMRRCKFRRFVRQAARYPVEDIAAVLVSMYFKEAITLVDYHRFSAEHTIVEFWERAYHYYEISARLSNRYYGIQYNRYVLGDTEKSLDLLDIVTHCALEHWLLPILKYGVCNCRWRPE